MVKTRNVSLLLIIAIPAVALIRAFLFEVESVQGNSMLPALKTGDRVLVSRLSRTAAPGDWVSVEDEHHTRVIKNVIARPGDIYAGRLYDSTYLLDGLGVQSVEPFEVPRDRVVGRVVAVVWKSHSNVPPHGGTVSVAKPVVTKTPIFQGNAIVGRKILEGRNAYYDSNGFAFAGGYSHLLQEGDFLLIEEKDASGRETGAFRLYSLQSRNCGKSQFHDPASDITLLSLSPAFGAASLTERAIAYRPAGNRVRDLEKWIRHNHMVTN